MSFVTDIQLMMHGFGDCRKPLSDTATIIETIVHQQMSSFLQQALEVSELRDSKVVSPEDILFIMRRDHLKLQRLVNYMGVRDLYQRTSAIANGSFAKTDPTSENDSSVKKICTNFLLSIDQTGEYDAICSGNLYDQVKLERALRQDSMAQGMSAARYKEYCQARKASFCPRLRLNKFREWLQTGENAEIKLSQHVLEMLNFLAYETVAQIVDLSLLVKRDSTGRNSDLSRFQTPTMLNPDYPSVLIQQVKDIQAKGSMMQQTGGLESGQGERVGMDPITPSEVREAIRRYWSNNSSFSPFSKVTSPLGSRLLAG